MTIAFAVTILVIAVIFMIKANDAFFIFNSVISIGVNGNFERALKL